jgi:hypothetical protein
MMKVPKLILPENLWRKAEDLAQTNGGWKFIGGVSWLWSEVTNENDDVVVISKEEYECLQSYKKTAQEAPSDT